MPEPGSVRNSTPSLRVEGPAAQSFVDEVMEALDPLLAGAEAATDQDRFLFALAVSEVLTNIVQHGGNGATMRIEIDATADELRAQIWDTAAPAVIDWDSLRLPGDDAESGRGLVLAISVLNELRHTRSAAGNTWLLQRHIQGEPPDGH
jgi:serine/threonine-protein kinase RsbW